MSEPARDMDVLCRLYLELANVVPADCVSSRELKLGRTIGKFGVALRMIAAGGGDPPSEFAARILAEVESET